MALLLEFELEFEVFYPRNEVMQILNRLKNRILLLLLLLAGLTLTAGCTAVPAHEFAGLAYEAPIAVPDFTLQSAAGPVSLSDFRGRYVLLYFGYTYCPDACPATLAELNKLDEILGERAAETQVIFVSVDPERDTPERLAEYVGFFDESFVGATGSPQEIDLAAAPLGVFFEKTEGSAASGYLINHTTRTFLIDPQGQALVAYPFDAQAESIAADLTFLFEQS